MPKTLLSCFDALLLLCNLTNRLDVSWLQIEVDTADNTTHGTNCFFRSLKDQ